MGLFNRNKGSQSGGDRRQMSEHLEELDSLLDEKFRDLGDTVLEMYATDGVSGRALWSSAAEIDSIESEAALVRRGLDEGLSLTELQALARQESGKSKEAGATAQRPDQAPGAPAGSEAATEKPED